MVVTLKPSEATGSLHITIQLKGRPPLLSTLIPLLKNTIHLQLIFKNIPNSYQLLNWLLYQKVIQIQRVFVHTMRITFWRPTWGLLHCAVYANTGSSLPYLHITFTVKIRAFIIHFGKVFLSKNLYQTGRVFTTWSSTRLALNMHCEPSGRLR